MQYDLSREPHTSFRHSKKLYAWETAPVDDLALLLLCGEAEFKVCLRQSMLPIIHLLMLYFVYLSPYPTP